MCFIVKEHVFKGRITFLPVKMHLLKAKMVEEGQKEQCARTRKFSAVARAVRRFKCAALSRFYGCGRTGNMFQS